MQKILLIGVGGTGTETLDAFWKIYNHSSQKQEHEKKVYCFTYDRFFCDVSEDFCGERFFSPEVFGNSLIDHEIAQEYGITNSSESDSLYGRKKEYLYFLSMLRNRSSRLRLEEVLEDFCKSGSKLCQHRLVLVCSIAGVTGSSVFLPLVLWVKNFLKKRRVHLYDSTAFLVFPEAFRHVCPSDLYESIMNANAYVALRELNTVQKLTSETDVPVRGRVQFGKMPDVLFDSDNVKYRSIEYMPFNRVFFLSHRYENAGEYDDVFAQSLFAYIFSARVFSAMDNTLNCSQCLYGEICASMANIPSNISTDEFKDAIIPSLEENTRCTLSFIADAVITNMRFVFFSDQAISYLCEHQAELLPEFELMQAKTKGEISEAFVQTTFDPLAKAEVSGCLSDHNVLAISLSFTDSLSSFAICNETEDDAIFYRDYCHCNLTVPQIMENLYCDKEWLLLDNLLYISTEKERLCEEQVAKASAEKNRPVSNKERYVFISYSSYNQALAESMRSLLIEEKIENWMAPYDIPAGYKYAHVINDALENCACVLLLLSEKSQESEFVEREIERAVSYKKPVVTMRLDDCVLNSGFKYYLGASQIVSVRSIDRNNYEMQKVLKALKSIVNLE